MTIIPSVLSYENTQQLIDPRVGAERYAEVRHTWGDAALLSRLSRDPNTAEVRREGSSR